MTFFNCVFFRKYLIFHVTFFMNSLNVLDMREKKVEPTSAVGFFEKCFTSSSNIYCWLKGTFPTAAGEIFICWLVSEFYDNLKYGATFLKLAEKGERDAKNLHFNDSKYSQVMKNSWVMITVTSKFFSRTFQTSRVF